MKFRRAFTLLELLVVIAIIAIDAALLMPVLTRAKQRAQGVLCLNGGRQLMMAMIVYVSDNHDFFPPNPDDGNTQPGYNWCSGNASIGGPAEFNPDLLKDPALSLLTGYLSGNTSLFHCPGDKRMGVYQGTDPSLKGQIVPAARTFSMNQAVGTIDPAYDATRNSHGGIPSLSVNGPWLNNQFNHRRDSPWCTYGKMTSLRAPGPSSTWVLLDEDPVNLNDAAFAFGMQIPQWIDVPGSYHNSGCGFAFADGHSEAHRWQMAGPKHQSLGSATITDANDRNDWLWLRARTSADSTGTMPAP
jgi:prepilin-type N-terminal cleavage/methylation domain-containing protein/prepilin-type processing-associated H-X9-DG protein